MHQTTLFDASVAHELAALDPQLSLLGVHDRLRKLLGKELGRQAAELHELRKRAVRKLGTELVPYLTAKGLEQASHPSVAAARAQRLAGRASQIWDATAGIGLDSLALAARGALGASSDLDMHTARCAAANLRHAGHGTRVVRADASRPPFSSGPDGVLIDPDRRVGGQRSLDPKRWSPTLDQALEVAARFGGGCIKLAPGLDPALSDGIPGARAEWTSFAGELAEVTLWTGTWALGPPLRAAVLIQRDGSIRRLQGTPRPANALEPSQAQAPEWLADPDPAIVRSGLLGALAHATGMRPLAPQLAYLAGPQAPPGPFLRAWRVLDTCPLDRRRVRAMLAKFDIGPIHVRKRGHPDTAEVLAKRFSGPGERRGHLAVARLERGHLALLLEPGDGIRPPQGPMKADRGPEGGDLVGDEGFEPPTSSV